MFYRWFIIFMVILCNGSLAFAGEVEDQLTKLLTNYQTLTASFSQKVYVDGDDESNEAAGTMALKRPGKFLWNIQSPSPQQLIANGDTFWTYDIPLEQAVLQKIDVNNQDTPAYLLVGKVSELEKRFHVEPQPAGKDEAAFKLAPKKENDIFQWVILNFKSDKLHVMWLKDNLGQLSEFQFSDVVLNPKLDDSLFVFRPTKGVDVLADLP